MLIRSKLVCPERTLSRLQAWSAFKFATVLGHFHKPPKSKSNTAAAAVVVAVVVAAILANRFLTIRMRPESKRF
jgi:hypothetical protein